MDERYVTVLFITASKIKELSNSFFLGAKRRSNPEPPLPPYDRCIASLRSQ
jgi:hypothetical protein